MRAACHRLEVKGPRELAFFKGKAVGPVYSGFCYESEAGAHAAHIAFRPASHGGNAAANRSDNQDASQGAHLSSLTGYCRCSYFLCPLPVRIKMLIL